jgi:tetratricopeptide (TPR) repeat protein
MILGFFNARDAAEIGTALADGFAPQAAPGATPGERKTSLPDPSRALQELLRRADRDVRALRLNFYKKARFANSFKWRLIEHGVSREVADEVTQSLVLHLSQSPLALSEESTSDRGNKRDRARANELFHRANKYASNGSRAEAVELYEEVIKLDPSHAEAANNLGAALIELGRYHEAEQHFRIAIGIKPDFADAHGNLGALLGNKSELKQSESSLRLALKLKPNLVDARVSLGLTLAYSGRLREAMACFTKVLRRAPRHVRALYGMVQLAFLDGRFDEAEKLIYRILELDPRMTSALASVPNLRKMTAADALWRKRATDLVAGALRPIEEADLRYAMGKFYDDTNDFDQAFENYRRANDLLKAAADDYDRKKRTRQVDHLIRGHDRDALARSGRGGGSTSRKPVLIVGMPRSGTSLAEQIIAAHPAAHGAGELPFWSEAFASHEADLRRGVLDESSRTKIGEEYLQVLDGCAAHAQRVVDKAPVNSDYLGIVFSVFPNARVIYMQRDPIDTCLSCYFQHFMTGLNFTLDLSDLAHYYREHQRLMEHWRKVLPPGFVLEVPYEELVADQEPWSRRMIEFIGLEWDPRCLEFQNNKRQVVTASAWQVRQKIYRTSVARWRNYEKFIGPLKSLKQ